MTNEPRCPDCNARIGELHVPSCDIARCLYTGSQLISCPRGDHVCERDAWDGAWPGERDCIEYGFLLEDGSPDLNRLYIECDWDRDARRWIKRT